MNKSVLAVYIYPNNIKLIMPLALSITKAEGKPGVVYHP